MINNMQMTIKRDLMNSRVGRQIIGIIASFYMFIKLRKFCYIFYDDAWIHKYWHQTIVDSAINLYSSSDLESASSESWFYIYKPKFGDVIVDVGAGIGVDTLLFSKMVGHLGRVIVVEAHPKTFQYLSKMCKYNNLTNVVLCNYAVTDKLKDVFIGDSSSHICNTILNQESGYKVKGLTLDELLSKLNICSVNFLKMNIEGAENLAIHGMHKTLKKIQFICIACHDFLNVRKNQDSMKTKDMIIDFLKENGFEVILRNKDRRDWVRDHVHAKINKGFLNSKNSRNEEIWV